MKSKLEKTNIDKDCIKNLIKRSALDTIGFELKKYDLNNTEKTLLTYIEKNPKSAVTDVEMFFRMSRTRVTYTLQKLQDRQLISKALIGKKYVYILRKNAVKKYTQEISIEEMFARVRSSKHTKLYGIQSDGAINKLIEKLKTDSRIVEKIHRVQKQRSVIIEAIISSASEKNIKKLTPSIKKSHAGRPGIFYILPSALLGNFDIYFDATAVYLADYQKEIVTIIQEKELAKFFIILFNILKQSAIKKSTTDVYRV